jgi:hypothetical protein
MKMKTYDIDGQYYTVEHHATDGFTVWYTDETDHIVHKRFIDYTVNEALSIVCGRDVIALGQ